VEVIHGEFALSFEFLEERLIAQDVEDFSILNARLPLLLNKHCGIVAFSIHILTMSTLAGTAAAAYQRRNLPRLSYETVFALHMPLQGFPFGTGGIEMQCFYKRLKGFARQ
jgi:hypothetical protein